MVTICPIFIRALMTSEALTAILCANSATVMVSGTCTSENRASTGARLQLESLSRPGHPTLPFGPLRQLLERPAPAPVSPRLGWPSWRDRQPS